MTGKRANGTNPRATGSNPRATDGHPPVASPGVGVEKAGQEVSPQITIPTGTDIPQEELAPGELRWVPNFLVEQHPHHFDPVEKKMDLSEVDERKSLEEGFMRSAQEAANWGEHDDECPERKGKECGCRANLEALKAGELKELERQPQWWTEGEVTKDCVLVRVDDGRDVKRTVPDPMSQTAKPIVIVVHEPERWICLSCAVSMRGKDIGHHCDPVVKARATAPIALSRTLSPDVKFGGAYRLTIHRDRAGEYHLGEMVVVDGKVAEERHIAGPESYNVIESALLAASDKLTP